MSKCRGFFILFACVALSGCVADRLKFWDGGLEKEYSISGVDNQEDLKTYLQSVVETGREEELAEDEEQAYRDETIRLSVLKALKSRGYYDAVVKYTDKDEENGVFDVSTGKQSLISSVQVSPKSFQKYLDQIPLKAGDPLSATQVLAAQRKLYQLIEKESCAYNLSVVHRVGLDQQTYEADVTFEIEKGKDAEFGALTLTGGDSVEREYINKVITWDEGGCFKQSKIDSVKEKLLATGLFSRVEAVLPKNAKTADVIPVELALRERAPRTVSAGVSYYTDEGIGVILGWEHRNLLGQGEKFNADLTLSLLEQTLEGTLTKPYFMRNDQTLSINSFVKREDTDAYESFGLGGGFGVKRKFNKNFSASVGADVELTRIKEENETTDNFALLSPNASMTYDSRDDELDPHKGVLAKFSVEPTIDMFGESNPYITNKLTAQSYYEVHKKVVLAGRINVGSIVGSNAESLPVSKLFFAGGGGSVRGFGYQEVGPFEDGDPQGGRSLIESSLELRYKATDTLGAVAFVDVGEVDDKILPSLEDPSIGAGLGLRYYTDFGPLRFDVGVPLAGDDNTDENFQVYISIGQAFQDELLMKISLKKIARRSLKFFTWSVAVLMCLIVFVQLAFWAAIVWINSSSGQSFLQSALGTQLKESGYRVELGGFSYIFPTLMGVGSLTVYEGDLALVSVRNLRLDLDVFPLEKKELTIDLDIGEVTLEQSQKPKTQTTVQTEPEKLPLPVVLESMDLPDIYFTKIVLDDLSIGTLTVKGDKDIVLSPALSGEVVFKNARIAEVSLRYRENQTGAPDYMPEYIDMKGAFNTVLSELNIENIKVQAPLYSVSTHMQAVFREGEDFKVSVTGKAPSVANLSPVKIDIVAKNTADFVVHVKGAGSYFEKPISLNADIKSKGQIIDIQNLKARAPDVLVGGNIKFNTTNSIASGNVTATLDGLTAYQSFIGIGHELDKTTVNVALSGGASGQAYKIDLKSGGYKNRDANLSLRNIVMDSVFVGQLFTVNSLTLLDKDKNNLKANGTFNVATQAADFSVKADKYRALKGDMVNGVINADIRFFGDPQKYTIGGTLNPERIEIKIPERMGGDIPQLNVQTKAEAQEKQAPSVMQTIELDLIVDAPRQIFVRGWGLDAEFGGKLEVKGTASEPRVFGDFEVIRGRFAEFGKKFAIAKAKMLFSGTIPPSPKLDILTETKAGEIIAKIAITGNVMKPEMKFLSEPALPQDEVMSHILFGEDMDKISPFQAVQLAQAMQRFSGVGGGGSSFDPMGMLRSATGLDDIRVETDEEGQATVGAGKYLTDKVYLEFEAGSEEDSGNANVQVELTPNITLESEVGQDARAGAGVFWKWDYQRAINRCVCIETKMYTSKHDHITPYY